MKQQQAFRALITNRELIADRPVDLLIEHLLTLLLLSSLSIHSLPEDGRVLESEAEICGLHPQVDHPLCWPQLSQFRKKHFLPAYRCCLRRRLIVMYFLVFWS